MNKISGSFRSPELVKRYEYCICIMIYKHPSMTVLLIITDKQRIFTFLLLIKVQNQIQLIGIMLI